MVGVTAPRTWGLRGRPDRSMAAVRAQTWELAGTGGLRDDTGGTERGQDFRGTLKGKKASEGPAADAENQLETERTADAEQLETAQCANSKASCHTSRSEFWGQKSSF